MGWSGEQTGGGGVWRGSGADGDDDLDGRRQFMTGTGHDASPDARPMHGLR